MKSYEVESFEWEWKDSLDKERFCLNKVSKWGILVVVIVGSSMELVNELEFVVFDKFVLCGIFE